MKGIQNTTTGNFSSIIGNNRHFVVPKFQRDYSWGTEQWDDLWQDITLMIDEGSDHYMGYLVLQTSDDKNFNIIDGQQRFTTIILLILAAIKCIEKLAFEGVDQDDNNRRAASLKMIYIGKEDPVSLEYDNLLKLNRNNDAYYRDYIVRLGGLKIRNLKSTEKLMKNCFEFYEQKLSCLYQTGKEYASFIEAVVDNLFFTQIIVNDEMNAFRVFETLNARGVQLSSADLLKNYLFSLVDKEIKHESYIEILERKWAQLTDNIKAEKLPEFIRYYWNTKHRSIRANAVFKTIRREISSGSKVFALIDEMIRFSDIYMALTDPDDEMWDDEDVKKSISLLNLFKLKQPFSLLMAAKFYLEDAEFKKLLKYVVNLCFRYNVICDRNPNDQEAPFNNIALLISSEKRVDYSLLAPIVVNDATFKSVFSEKSFPYTSHNAKVIRYILGRLESFKGSSLKVQFNDDNASIEHIIPQDFEENWDLDEAKIGRMICRLGNTCLLEKRFNQEIKNENFEKKRVVYAQSKYYYSHQIAEKYSTWDDSAIIKLQKEMAAAAISIWAL